MKILLRHGNKENWKMVNSAAYINEKELQKLLAESPDLISIDDVRPGAGSLVAVVRELPLSIGSVDLVGFSAEGDLAIIECKLATNAEIKRKVIGQAFEYGAHIWRMSYDELDLKVRDRTNQSLAELIRINADDPDWDEEMFRNRLEQSLESGSFILMIIVDEINDELSRIIRFVNACGNPSFSFAALEMRRFQSGDAEMLVPRIIGDTRTTSLSNNPPERRRWTKELFYQDLKQRVHDGKIINTIDDLFSWSELKADEVRMGTGYDHGSFTFVYERSGISGSVFSVYSTGLMQINFGYMEKIFSSTEILKFKDRLSSIPGLEEIKESKLFYYSINISSIFDKIESINKFKNLVLELKSY